jgi:alkanesulfonate monooxygenase
MATTTITIRTDGEKSIIETASNIGNINGDAPSINGRVAGWTKGIANANGVESAIIEELTNGKHFTAPSDVNDDPNWVKFAYWVPNVSGGLVISKISQRTK